MAYHLIVLIPVMKFYLCPRAKCAFVFICFMLLFSPTHGQESRPDNKLNTILAQWDQDEHKDLHSVLILQQGKMIAEHYYNGATAASLHDARSVGKSITSLLLGIAVDRGSIRSTSEPVWHYWPASKGSVAGEATLAQVLSMRSGLAAYDADPASPGNEEKLDAASDPLAFILALPGDGIPGKSYRYNSVTACLAGITVEKATGQDLESFARTSLFQPMAISHWQWGRDVAGHPKGQGNLSLTARDFAKIGQLVLDKGMYQGQRVISATWIEAMLTPQVVIADVDNYADNYAYFWYSKTQIIKGKTVSVFFASGNGGNKIYVIPSLHAVVVVTSSAYGQGYGQRRSENILRSILAEKLNQ
ncbi:serine hydrolase domain-containing protein [Undibacterium sp. Ji42W]|uniref:serine hydrolase domain-containing protein n=1 Tax=Undibacterium sp. Ji42W TaxID=3413039 RepID=UPI003BF44383